MVVGQFVYSFFFAVAVVAVTSKLIYQNLSLNNLFFDYFHKQIKSAIIVFFILVSFFSTTIRESAFVKHSKQCKNYQVLLIKTHTHTVVSVVHGWIK